ncbi:MAG: DNA-binding response regulator [Sandaracinus sp.]|nr:DNA-binding response regulator [Sandaracinus sp.]MAQ17541.1 DNA-binding response regulator [Sandaracinus sp.]
MSETSQKVLLVEDDPALALGLVDTLEFEGFEVLHAIKGEDAIRLAADEGPDCIILDVMLPDMNGYQVCERVRRSDAHVPILMLTARSQEVDKIRGLDVGADDYVTKPFSVGELVARIRALLRRASRAPSVAEPFTIGDRAIDPAKQTLSAEGDEEQLGFYEIELLKLLHARRGQPVSRDEILEKVWGIEAGPTNRTVDNFIVKLRKKIEPVPNEPRYILTVYGVGYKLVP